MARTGMLASELAGELHALVAGEAVPPGLSSVAREKTEEPTLRSALASCLLTASGFMRWRRGAAAGGCEILTLRADPATLAIGESKSGSQGSTPPDACAMCRVESESGAVSRRDEAGRLFQKNFRVCVIIRVSKI